MNDGINGERVRDLRLGKRWTLDRLSEESGVDPRTISDIEHNRNRKPAHDKVVNLARALGVEPEEIWPVGLPKAVAS